MRKVVIVTDPMCSWCWGMTHEFEAAREKLRAHIDFDFMLGGINTHGTQPIGDYGRRFLMRLWREVRDTTGQDFGFKLPDEYVHNSSLPCLAVERVRDEGIDPAFEFLHLLQKKFFIDGLNVNDLELLQDEIRAFGVEPQELENCVNDPVYRERIRFQFDNASQFGTNAMPSLLIEKDGRLSLLAGGYVDAAMMESLLDEKS